MLRTTIALILKYGFPSPKYENRWKASLSKASSITKEIRALPEEERTVQCRESIVEGLWENVRAK